MATTHDIWLYSALSTFYEGVTRAIQDSVIARSAQVRTTALVRLQVIIDGAESNAMQHRNSTPSSVRDELNAIRKASRSLLPAQQDQPAEVQGIVRRYSNSLRDVAANIPQVEDPFRQDVIEALKAQHGSDQPRLALLSQYYLVMNEISILQIALVTYVANITEDYLVNIVRLSQHSWLSGSDSESIVSKAVEDARRIHDERFVPLLSGRSIALTLLCAARAISTESQFRSDSLERAMCMCGANVRSVLHALDAWSASSPLLPPQLDVGPLTSTLAQAERIVDESHRVLQARISGGVYDAGDRLQHRVYSPAPRTLSASDQVKQAWTQGRRRITDSLIAEEQRKVDEALLAVEDLHFSVYLRAKQKLRERHELVLSALDSCIRDIRGTIASNHQDWFGKHGDTLRAAQQRLVSLREEATRYGSEMSTCVNAIEQSSKARALVNLREIAKRTSLALLRATGTWT